MYSWFRFVDREEDDRGRTKEENIFQMKHSVLVPVAISNPFNSTDMINSMQTYGMVLFHARAFNPQIPL